MTMNSSRAQKRRVHCKARQLSSTPRKPACHMQGGLAVCLLPNFKAEPETGEFVQN
jgi:hypothetical protein